MNLINEIIHKAVTEESHKSRDSTWLVPNGNGSNQHTNIHSLAHSLKGLSGIVWKKKRCRRLRFLLTVILLSANVAVTEDCIVLGSCLSCGIMEVKEMHHISLNFSTDVDINSQKFDFQIELTDLEQPLSVTVVCGCYWFQGLEKGCFNLPGYICNSTTERLQVQIPQFSRQQAGKYQLRVLKGVHTSRTCILRIQELNVTTPDPSMNIARRSTIFTPDPPGRNGESRITIIIIVSCSGVILSIFVTAGVIIFYKKKALVKLIKKSNKFNDTTIPKPGTENGLKQGNDTEMLRMLS